MENFQFVEKFAAALPAIGIVLTSILGTVWWIYSAGRDRRVKTIESHEQMLADLLKQSEEDLQHCREVRLDMAMKMETMSIKISGLEEKLTVAKDKISELEVMLREYHESKL